MINVENYELIVAKSPEGVNHLFLSFDIADTPNISGEAVSVLVLDDKLRVTFKQDADIKDVFFVNCPDELIKKVKTFEKINVTGITSDGEYLKIFSTVNIT